MVDPLSYFSFHSMHHDWCNKGRGMCYPVCGMMHIKEPLLLIGNSSLCGGSEFPLSLSDWSFAICPTPYSRKWNVSSASLNKTFPSPPSIVRWCLILVSHSGVAGGIAARGQIYMGAPINIFASEIAGPVKVPPGATVPLVPPLLRH